MAYFEVDTNPSYNEDIEKLEVTTPAYAPIFNAIFQKILNRVGYVNGRVDAVDNRITQVTEVGIPKLMVYPLEAVAEEENQTEFEIALSNFDAFTDTVLVQSGRTMLSPNLDFSVGENSITLNEGVPLGRTITIYIFKNVPLGEDGSVSGRVIAPNTMKLTTFKTVSLTLAAADWSESFPYSITIEDENFKESDEAILCKALDGTEDEATVKAYEKVFGNIYSGVITEGAVTFYCKKKPETDITILLKGAS